MRRTQLAAVLFVLLLLIPSVGQLVSIAGWSSVFGVLGLVLIGVLAARNHYRTEQSDDKDGGSWGIIPNWQYEGRFAEAGGLTRSEQSEEIEKIQTEAGEVERSRK